MSRQILSPPARRLVAALLAPLLAGCAPVAPQAPTPAAPPSAVARPLASPTATPAEPSPRPTDQPSPSPAPPTATPAAAPTVAPAAADEIAALAATSRLPRDQVALARELGACRPDPTVCPEVARQAPLDVAVGDTQPFFVSRIDDDRTFAITATLRYAGPVVLMYVEEGAGFSQADLDAAARRFEEEIYPRTRAVFGSETQPGVDGDPRITVLNTTSIDAGILGYFAARDSLPRQVNRFSNEREMFVMNISSLSFGSPAYLDVLAHEFQHMIHRNEQPITSTWFNEGSSNLAQDLNGFVSQGYAVSYLFRPDTQLTAWTDQPGETIPHYGAAHLFMRYIFAQYADEADLLGLIRADAGNNLDAFVELAARRRPDVDSFAELFGDWATANLLDDGAVADGRFTYRTRPGLPTFLEATVEPVAIERESLDDDVAQFGADYLRLPAGPSELTFQGATTVTLVGDRPRGRLAWWSGRSDNSYATLTRPLDLRGVSGASLVFDAWYEIESGYDYAFVSVSTDGGRTWEPLRSTGSTEADPHGHNYGFGLTGASGSSVPLDRGGQGAWVEERADLTPFAGQEVLLRFWHITDEGFNAPGLLIDNIRVPEIGLSDDGEAGPGGWEAAGFALVDGELPQRWELRLVRTAADGAVSVERLPVDDEGRAAASLGPGETGVLLVAGVTPLTTERAAYSLDVR